MEGQLDAVFSVSRITNMPAPPPDIHEGVVRDLNLDHESISMQLRHVCLEYPYAQLEAATHNFHESGRLGHGSAGSVYRAEMPDASYAAVKVIDLAELGDNALVAGFEDEIMILSKFRHPNLVVLMGWAREGSRRFLIYEFMPGGDLTGRLQKSKEGRIPFLWHERLFVLRDAATGLAHLHNAKPRAFHRDIKSSNILLSNTSAKMADFGLSCVAKCQSSSAVNCKFASGTPGYACPTYLKTGKVTESAEVYSFGMVMLETLLNLLPAGMLGNEIKFPIQDTIQPQKSGAIDRAVAHADPTAGFPPPVSFEVASLALLCTQAEEARRPNFVDICRKLRSLQEQFPPSCIMGMPSQLGGFPGAFPMMSGTNVSHPPMPGWQMMPPGMPHLQQVQQRPWSHHPMVALAPGSVAMFGMQGFNHPALSSGAMPRPNFPQFASTPAVGLPFLQGNSHLMPGHLEVALEITYVRLAVLANMKPEFRMLPLLPDIETDGRRVARFGRAFQAQWLEAVLLDASDLASISREACEFSWGGADPLKARLCLRVLGSGAVLIDDVVIRKGDVVRLSPGTRIILAKQGLPSTAPEIIIAFAVHCAAFPSGLKEDEPGGMASLAADGNKSSVNLPRSDFPSVPEERACDDWPQEFDLRQDALTSDADWTLDCVFAAGFAPQDFTSLPRSVRQVAFQLQADSAPKVIGREHQPDMFRALLAHEPSLLTRISRSHFLLESPSAGFSSVKVTNLSANVAVVAQTPLHQGQSIQVSDGDTLSFGQPVPALQGIDSAGTASAPEEISIIPFLTFRLVGPPIPVPPTPFSMLSFPSLSVIGDPYESSIDTSQLHPDAIGLQGTGNIDSLDVPTETHAANLCPSEEGTAAVVPKSAAAQGLILSGLQLHSSKLKDITVNSIDNRGGADISSAVSTRVSLTPASVLRECGAHAPGTATTADAPVDNCVAM